MLALEIKGVGYQLRRLDNAKREQKSPEFLSISPRGHVPALIDGDDTICETLAVLSYLDAAIPAPGLFGDRALETARIWQTICSCDAHLRDQVGDISRPLFRGKADESADQITEAASGVRDELSLLEEQLAASPWLASENISAADVTVYPVLMQLARAVARDDAAFLDLALHPFGDHFPKIDNWCRRIEALPGFENAYPPHWK